MGDIKTTPILVNMLNELQNKLSSKCGRSAVCLYMCVYRCIHISAFVGFVSVCVWCINAKSTQLKISLRDITYTRRATLNEN